MLRKSSIESSYWLHSKLPLGINAAKGSSDPHPRNPTKLSEPNTLRSYAGPFTLIDRYSEVTSPVASSRFIAELIDLRERPAMAARSS